MSILIKGLNIKEMVYCPFCGEEYGECLISKNREYCERLEKCPYEIIPDHGELIDRDELMKHGVYMPMQGGNLPLVYMSYVKGAKAVIPAEGSEE